MNVFVVVFWTALCFSTGAFSARHKRDTYNILLAVPVASKSLHNLFSSLAKCLVQNGHSVTLLTSFKASQSHPNLTHFQPGDFSSPLNSRDDFFAPMSSVELASWIKKANSEIIHSFWTNEAILKLHQKRNQFDAIVYPSYMNEVFMPFLDDFKGISILFCTPGVEYNTISMYGNWLSLAIVPHITLPYDDQMNFWERSVNLFMFYVYHVIFSFIFLPSFLEEMRIYFPHFKHPKHYYQQSSLTLINGHFALDGPVPLLPNQVEVGTINAEKSKPLPKELESFSNGAGDAGVIYFSLGSFVKGKDIPSSAKKIFVDAFGRLPQRVIWKYEGDDLKLPPNVITRKWFPQQDILGHPQTKIFMSHCGNLGTQEAKYHGVPVLALPIAFDQPRNAVRLVRKGYGLMLTWDELTVGKLLDAVVTLINNSEYENRLKSVSMLLQDQMEMPAERAVWWVEYVIRHKGAPHLRFAGQRLYFLQYMMVDVLVFWTLLFTLFFYIVINGCKKAFKSCPAVFSRVKQD